MQKLKANAINKITFCPLKNYSPDGYKEALRKLNLPSYELFDNVNKDSENFIKKSMAVIYNLAASKNRRIKVTSILLLIIGLMLKSWKK